MKYTPALERNGYLVIGAATAIAIGCILLTGCANTSAVLGVDHTSHALQHVRQESTDGMRGCTGPIAGLRYQRQGWFAQATEKYCVNGWSDQQKEVFDFQAGYLIPLGR